MLGDRLFSNYRPPELALPAGNHSECLFAPGFINTDMTHERLTPKRFKKTEVQERAIPRFAWLGTPKTSPTVVTSILPVPARAASYVTGQVIAVRTPGGMKRRVLNCRRCVTPTIPSPTYCGCVSWAAGGLLFDRPEPQNPELSTLGRKNANVEPV